MLFININIKISILDIWIWIWIWILLTTPASDRAGPLPLGSLPRWPAKQTRKKPLGIPKDPDPSSLKTDHRTPPADGARAAQPPPATARDRDPKPDEKDRRGREAPCLRLLMWKVTSQQWGQTHTHSAHTTNAPVRTQAALPAQSPVTVLSGARLVDCTVYVGGATHTLRSHCAACEGANGGKENPNSRLRGRHQPTTSIVAPQNPL